jgi:hypothetical protein
MAKRKYRRKSVVPVNAKTTGRRKKGAVEVFRLGSSTGTEGKSVSVHVSGEPQSLAAFLREIGRTHG